MRISDWSSDVCSSDLTDLIQGSEEWLQARCGLLTASEMKLIVTPTLKAANNDKTRTHLYELLAQRVTGYVEPHYISDDMLRGMDDEIIRSEEHTSELQSLKRNSYAVFCLKTKTRK